MSSKTKWAESAKKYVNTPQNRGRVPPPTLSSNSDAEATSVDLTSELPIRDKGSSQEHLLRALITSQKQTIDNYQKDLKFERNKIAELETQVRFLHAKAKGQDDYNALKKQTMIGFQGGYEQGMAKVENTFPKYIRNVAGL